MVEIRSTVTEMKNTFEGLISRLDRNEERISELEDISAKTPKTEKQTEILKKMGKKEQNRIVKHYGVTTKGVTYV